MMDQIKISKSSPDKKYSPKARDPTSVVPSKKRFPPLEGGHSTKKCGIWTLKHNISSTKFYKLLIKTEFKEYTATKLNN